MTLCWCSHRSLGVVNDKLEMMSETNLLAGEIGEESQFEGITYSDACECSERPHI